MLFSKLFAPGSDLPRRQPNAHPICGRRALAANAGYGGRPDVREALRPVTALSEQHYALEPDSVLARRHVIRKQIILKLIARNRMLFRCPGT